LLVRRPSSASAGIGAAARAFSLLAGGRLSRLIADPRAQSVERAVQESLGECTRHETCREEHRDGDDG
jgi:hypothetical protein